MRFLLPLLALGCVPKAPPVPAHRLVTPPALAAGNYQPPSAATGTLSNGIVVTVVENHEVPLVWVSLYVDRGHYTDPADQPGLASVTMDMLNEGAGEYDAAGLSKAARSMASSLSSSASSDSAILSIKSLTKNLSPTLDLMSLVLRSPSFAQLDWDLMRKKRLQDLTAARNNPRKIHARVWSKLLYGDGYRGAMRTEAAYESISTADMRAWAAKHLAPDAARIFVGGDTTLAAVMPLLEARFGDWEGQSTSTKLNPTMADRAQGTHIVVVDKPGAPQSVIKVGQRVHTRKAEDYYSAMLANFCYGGMFIARLNMNLREDKGWTYGARSRLSHSHLDSVFSAGASVITDKTAESVSEILRELRESQSTRVFSSEELDGMRGALLGSRSLRFESTGYLLGQARDIWIYDLPEDWVTSYPDKVRSVTLDEANAAWRRWINPDQLTILVVGDAATIRPGLEALGYPLTQVDADGQPVGATP
jgi:zinc protease